MAIDLKKFYGRFIEEAREHIAQLNNCLATLQNGDPNPDVVNAIFRSAHTIKGSSLMLKLEPIAQTTHKLEDVLCALRDGSIAFNPQLGQTLHSAVDALSSQIEQLAKNLEPADLPAVDTALCAELDLATQGKLPNPLPEAVPQPSVNPEKRSDVVPSSLQLKTADTVRVPLHKLDETIKLMGEVVSSHARLRQRLLDARQLERSIPPLAGNEPLRAQLRQFSQALKDDVQAQESLMHALHDKALVMRMLPLAIVFDPAGRMLRELAYSVGKQVECDIRGAEIELDRHIIDKLADPLIHLLRNAVDHGMETTQERLAAGKPALGRIRLSAWQDSGWVVIEVADDGGGIDLQKVRDKAVRKGIVSPENARTLTEQEIIDLIFLPGFSTNALITDLSGRGVGMDVVKKCIVEELQGQVSVSTALGSGTTISMRLPLSLAVMRVLTVSAGGLSFCFTAQNVVELLRIPRQAQIEVAGRQAVIIRNEFIPVQVLADLLQIPAQPVPPPTASALGLLVMVIRVRNDKLALVIDHLLDERDMIIKPLPLHMQKLATVSGMVITGGNALVSVLHAPALLNLARRARANSANFASAQATPYKVLVVDDSLNTREIEKDVLQALGYQVTLAENGLDGLTKALAGDFDAILTDVEMPVMDGFTLTARLRQEEKYRTCPIVIITSREKADDKRRGLEAGADAYLVKGDFDQINMVKTLQSLLG